MAIIHNLADIPEGEEKPKIKTEASIPNRMSSDDDNAFRNIKNQSKYSNLNLKGVVTDNYKAALSSYTKAPISPVQRIANAAKQGGGIVVKYAGENTREDDGLGSTVIRDGINAASAGVEVFHVAQKISPVIIDSVNTASRGIATVASTAETLNTIGAPVPMEMTRQILRQNAKLTGLNDTNLGSKIFNLAETSSRISSSAMDVSVGKLQGVKGLADRAGKGAIKGAAWMQARGIPKIASLANSGILKVGQGLAESDDMTVSTVGDFMQASSYGIKAAAVGGKILTGTAKGSIKTARNIAAGISYIKNNGIKKAAESAKKKLAQSAIKLGKSAVSNMVELARKIGVKVALPLLIIVALLVAMTSAVVAPVAFLGTIFGEGFEIHNDDGKVVDKNIRDYLADTNYGVPAMRANYITELHDHLASCLRANGGDSHIVRLKVNDSESYIEWEPEKISEVIYTDSELCNILQPIYNAVLLQKYGLEVSEKDAHDVLQSMFSRLFRLQETASVEYCGQDLKTGNGTAIFHSCGDVHALPDCPNKHSGFHNTYVCPSCCYVIYYMGAPVDFGCMGYCNCGGHNVLTATLCLDGLYELLNDYFYAPIDQLANKTDRTQDEEKQLEDLKSYLEICEEYIRQTNAKYGGGIAVEDISNIQFVAGTRVGNSNIANLAISQTGNVGGKTYWSWYGFSSRVEWCGCFVSWCMAQCGRGDVRFASCNSGGIPYFRSIGRYLPGTYTDLAAGDVIFFDWDGDGSADHTGIVAGRDEKYVYTIEGNNGDTCRVKKYMLGSTVICGYGLI